MQAGIFCPDAERAKTHSEILPSSDRSAYKAAFMISDGQPRMRCRPQGHRRERCAYALIVISRVCLTRRECV